jgi:NADPH:quinone reductase-like Zn-dependent oxidoreductase
MLEQCPQPALIGASEPLVTAMVTNDVCTMGNFVLACTTNHLNSPETAMRAAVVTSFGAAPRYQEFPTPEPVNANEMLVDVLAAGLHPRVRSQADGSHYTSTDELPLVPGIDGVGRGADGLLRYFILPETTMGAMAEQTVIDLRRSLVLPDTSDPVAVAAAMNPAMSSWVALRQRVQFQAGQNVLVLGATGNAGRLAVQLAALLGANQVVAAGRNADRLANLARLGATDTVLLDGDADNIAHRLGQAAADADVVIDYLWGEPTAAAMVAVVTGRADRSKPLTWIEIGSVAGPTAAIPSAALRAVRLQIVGSGQGSVGTHEILAELPALAEAITSGTFDIGARPMPLCDVEKAWADSAGTTQRIVLMPQR